MIMAMTPDLFHRTLTYFLRNISHKKFAGCRRDIDLSTLVSCVNTNLLFPVYNLMYIKGYYFDNDKYTIVLFCREN